MASFDTKEHRSMSTGRGNEPPVTHTGYLKKLGQKRQNWKRRYIVVELGRLTYFEKSNGTTEPPYGIGQKGVIMLAGYEVQKGSGEFMLLLKHRTEKRELLVEVENGERDLVQWREVLEGHIQFSDENPSLALQDGATFQEDEGKRAATALMYRNAADLADNEDELDDEKAGVLSAPKPIQLNPGFVIKSKRVNGLKVFFNVCDHDDIPQSDKKRGNKKWPIFVLSPACKISVDKNADKCHVLDVCVHPSVMQECTTDTTGETKEEVCLKIMDAVMLREKREKVESPIDKSVFSFPRLAKKYKGDTVPRFLVPRNMHALKNKTQVFTAIDLKDHVANIDTLLEEESKAVTEAKKQNIEAAELEAQSGSPSGAPKKYIYLNVVRQTGAVVRGKPEKAAPRIQTLLQKTQAYCYGRRVARDGSCWYRLLEGWTAALTDGGQRMLKPIYLPEPPRNATLTGFNIVEAQEKGFFFDKTVKKVTFSLQLNYTKEHDVVLSLQRSYDEFITLESDLAAEGNLQQDVPFPRYGIEALKAEDVPVDLLLELLHDLSSWLHRTLNGAAASCTAIKLFMEPTEVDCRKMDIDLSATGGLGGSWPVEYN